MRISGKRRWQNRQRVDDLRFRYRINQFIRVPQVRVIGDEGQNLGVMDTGQALQLAQDQGLDLVEVNPTASPPVVKITSFSKLKYQEEKERRKGKARQKKVEIKGIRLSLRIGKHDLDVRQKQALSFLENGDKVKIEMILRGRERGHADLARKVANDFIAALNQIKPVKVEQPLSIQGGKLSVIVG